jgi:formylglycine-generating enzyme required for sulfatase activity
VSAPRSPLGRGADKPVIAFVQPKDQPAEEMSAAAQSAPDAPADAGELREGETALVLGDDERQAGAAEVETPEVDVVIAAIADDISAAPSGDAAAPETSETIEDPIALLAEAATPEGAETPIGLYFRDCVECPDMAEVAPGVLTPTSEDGGPPVLLARPIAVAVRETTNEEWAHCVADGVCPSRPGGADEAKRPVAGVTWSEAQTYASWLSAKTGRRYRLPTETEWEFAARAGSTDAYSFGAVASADEANYDSMRGGALPVASFPPNAFGVYDMHGNIAEWTADCWTGEGAGDAAEPILAGGPCSSRVVKGGAWNDPAADIRAAHREADAENARRDDVGFRLVRDLR